jgi:hypothetical protein
VDDTAARIGPATGEHEGKAEIRDQKAAGKPEAQSPKVEI